VIRDPVDLGYVKGTVEEWRRKLWNELGPRCVVCGNLADHLHEGILWRSEVQGFPFPTRLRVFADCNSFPVCATCHSPAPSREFFFEMSCRRYGEQEVRAWYGSFPWRVVPDRRFMPNAIVLR